MARKIRYQVTRNGAFIGPAFETREDAEKVLEIGKAQDAEAIAKGWGFSEADWRIIKL